VKFSVVTPSYRQLPWLKLCAASIADQGGVEVEHIIQDAGTGGDLEAWAVSQPNLRLFAEPDAGMYDAINRGLRRATGEICAYLNCDEQYLPGALGRVAKFFAAHPEVNVLFGDVILVDQQGTPLSYRRTVLPVRSHVRLAHLNTSTCATFFRRELVDRGFHFDAQWKVIGDAIWIERLLNSKIAMATIHEPLAAFTFTGNNLGETPASRSEALTWKGDTRGNRLDRVIAVVWHRLRKALAGAYRRRDLEIDIFTLQSPERRQRRIGKQVGFRWPSDQTGH
jgi:glycosyltransferase involved in cell wall biosynthesis